MGEETRRQIEEAYRKFTGGKIVFILLCVLLIVIVTGFSASIGSYDISVTQVFSILFRGLFRRAIPAGTNRP